MILKLSAPTSLILTLLLLGFLPAGALSAVTPSLEKTWSYGSPYANDLAVDSSGNITIVGGDNGNMLLLRYNVTGSLLLQKLWSGSNSQEATGVAVDALGNTYATGLTSSSGNTPAHLFLVKFDPNGNVVWQETYTGNSVGGGVTVASGGDVIVSGNAGNGTLLGFSSTGSLLWQDTWKGTQPQLYFQRVAEDAYGDIYTISIAGLFKFSSSGVLLWARSWRGMSDGLNLFPPFHPDISVDASGNVYLVGVGSVNTGTDSIYLLKLSADGNLLWQRRWETLDTTMQYEGVAANASSIIYVTGMMSICVPNPRGCNPYPGETLILEFNSTGSVIGMLGIQASELVGLGRPSVDSKGSLYLTGTGSVAGASFCSPQGGLSASSVSLITTAGQVVTLPYNVVPVSGTVSTPAGNETSQSGVFLVKFDPRISGGYVSCSPPLEAFPATLSMVTLMGAVVILHARKRLFRVSLGELIDS